VSRTTLSRLIKGQTGVSPDMAIRQASIWIRMQAFYDLAQTRRHQSRIKVNRFEPPQVPQCPMSVT
jgi:plasmid maintenance system antidote protein VapI